MTDQELKDLVASLAVQSAKTDVQLAQGFKELRESQSKTDAQLAKTDAQLAKTDAQLAKTDATLKKLGIYAKNTNTQVDGTGKTNGEIAQEFFFSSLDKNPMLGGVKFDSIQSSVRTRKAGKEHEMDIFLENGNSVGIVEVKSKVRCDDISQLKSIVAQFYQFHPIFKSYKIIPALAGKVFSKQLQEQTLKAGFIVLTQQGNHIEQRLPS